MRRFALLVLLSCCAACADDATDRGDATDVDADDASDASADDVVESTDTLVDSGDASDADSSDVDDAASAATAVDRLVAIPNPTNPLSWFVQWRTDAPAPSVLHVTCDDGEYDVAHVHEAATDRHELFVMGLWPEASCVLTARIADGVDEGAMTLETAIDPAPDWLPEPTVTVHQPDAVSPGWTFLNLSDEVSDAPEVIAALDAQGRYRWLHRRQGATVARYGFDLHVVPGGIVTGGRRRTPPGAVIDWTGEVRWEAGFGSHHELRPSPWGESHMLFLGFTRENCPENTVEGTVNEVNIDTGEIEWSWNVCDHVTPRQQRPDWSHLNAIEPIPDTRQMLISSREQHQVYLLDRDDDAIVWTLGVGGDFEMDDDAYFYRQHAPEWQPDGQILIFDNRRASDGYSRAVEYRLTFDDDGAPLAAEVAWQFADETLFSSVRGDADRVANGNTLITYGALQPGPDLMLLEVDGNGERVWQWDTPEGWGAYRSERVAVPPFVWHADDFDEVVPPRETW